MRNQLFLAVVAVLVVACNAPERPVVEKPETAAQRQVKVCTEEIKLGLNDPNSFELMSSEAIKVNDGTHRLQMKFTAKNEMGGRVRGEELCGFRSEESLELNPDDIANKMRAMGRSVEEARKKFR